MKYPAVAACEDEFPVSRLCEVFDVSESGYYAWLNRPLSQRAQANRGLGEHIQAIWQRFRGTYGAPRIHADLQAEGEVVGHNRVARIMQHLGLRAKGRANGSRVPPSPIPVTDLNRISLSNTLMSPNLMQSG